MKHSEKYGNRKFDILVVGGGHAGIEASLAAARLGCSTGLITMSRDAIGRMSCNPAIGGTAKGHLVKEIDALGGEMGSLADATGIHFRMLNKSKGPAVWSPRCQNDRKMYEKEASARVLVQEGLAVLEDMVLDIVVESGRITGVLTEKSGEIRCRALVLCGGTFLNAVMHTGMKSTAGGRIGERSSDRLSARLDSLGFLKGRLKTGTPPRISKGSVDFSNTESQYPDLPPVPFSHRTKEISNEQIPMYLTYTNPETHMVLRTGFSESPMFTGRIKGVGPRYCPSIEDKIDRFADRDRHQIFLEPEGYNTDIVYVNGFSTSLPSEVQERALRTIPGLTNCRVLRPGYAVEYDFFPPHQLYHTLETKLIKGLYFAGQINGTSGYEEAGAQGLMAGINAVLAVQGKPPLILGRDESYIGVLVDDLINKGTEEPYRIFTSRAEYRLILRADNADSRLMRKGHDVGLISRATIVRLTEKEKRISEGRELLASTRLKPDRLNPVLAEKQAGSVSELVSMRQILKRAGMEIRDLLPLVDGESGDRMDVVFGDESVMERVQIEVKYEGYLHRQEEQVRLFKKHEAMAIPPGFDYEGLRSLSLEGKEKLSRVQPRSIGQATRISGVTPADVAVLMVHLRN